VKRDFRKKKKKKDKTIGCARFRKIKIKKVSVIDLLFHTFLRNQACDSSNPHMSSSNALLD